MQSETAWLLLNPQLAQQTRRTNTLHMCSGRDIGTWPGGRDAVRQQCGSMVTRAKTSHLLRISAEHSRQLFNA